MREAQRTRHFPLSFAYHRGCDIYTKRATSSRYQVQLAGEKGPHAHNSQYVEHQTGLQPFNSTADQIMSFNLHIGIGRHWSLLVGADWLV
jgi:hypothetical protein